MPTEEEELRRIAAQARGEDTRSVSDRESERQALRFEAAAGRGEAAQAPTSTAGESDLAPTGIWEGPEGEQHSFGDMESIIKKAEKAGGGASLGDGGLMVISNGSGGTTFFRPEGFKGRGPDPSQLLAEQIQREAAEAESSADVAKLAGAPVGEQVGEFLAQAPRALTSGVRTAAELAKLPVGAAEVAAGFFDPSRTVRPGGTETGDVIRGAIDAPAEALERAIDPGEPVTPAGQAGAAIFEEVGGAAIPAGALIKRGKTLQRAGRTFGTGLIGRAEQQAAQRTGKFLLEESLGAVGAGTAGAIFQGAGTGTETAARVAGGLAATTPVAFARGGLDFAKTFSKAKGQEAKLEALVDDLLGSPDRFGRATRDPDFSRVVNQKTGELTPLGIDAAIRIRRASGNVDEALRRMDNARANAGALNLGDDGFTTGSGANVPGLRQIDMEVAATEPEIMLMQEMMKESANSRLTRVFTGMGGYPGLSGADAATAGVEMNLNRRMRQLDADIAAIAPDLDSVQLSRIRAQKLDEMATEWEKESRQAYNQLDDRAETLGARWNKDTLQDSVSSIRKEQVGTGDFEKKLLPQEIMNLIDDLPQNPEFKALRSALRRVNADLRDPNTHPSTKRWLGRIRDGLTDTYDELEFPDNVIGVGAQDASELSVQTQRSNEIFSNGAKIFRDNDAGKILATKSKIAAEDVMDKYIHVGPGSSRDATVYRSVFGNDPTAVGAAEDFLVGKAFQHALDETGSHIRPRQLRKFKERWAQPLEQFPGAARKLESVESLATEARALGVPTVEGSIAIQDKALATFVDSPAKFFRRMRNSKNPEQMLDNLIESFGGETDPLLALRRHFWDDTLTEKGVSLIEGATSNVRRVDPNHIRNVLDRPQNQVALKKLFSEGHIESLDLISQVQDVYNRIPSGNVARIQDLPGVSEEAMKLIRSSGLITVILNPAQRGFRVTRAVQRFAQSLSAHEIQKVIAASTVSEPLTRILMGASTDANVARLDRWLTTNLPTTFARTGREERQERAALIRNAPIGLDVNPTGREEVLP